jgi:hypothetical protein
MSAPLISSADMAMLTELDESSMPSTCQFLRPVKTGTRTARGAMVRDGYSILNPVPLKCRVRSDQSREINAQSSRIESRSSPSLAVPLGSLSFDLNADDLVDVTTTYVDGRGTVVKRYKLAGEPYTGSYGTHVSVALSEVRNGRNA